MLAVGLQYCIFGTKGSRMARSAVVADFGHGGSVFKEFRNVVARVDRLF
jgi:hypothetical protein